VNTIPGIEEVNIFKDDVVIQFQNPKGEISPCEYVTSTDY
jgi:nascent polypeptide-associated complex subunit beta